MSDLDFSFQDSPWELYLNTKRPGETVSAAHFLTLLEEETESTVEDAFAALEERGLSLDISGLPVREFSGQAALRLKQELEWSEKGLDPDLIPPNDPLRLYLEEVAAFRQEDEAALAEMAARGDETAEEKRMTLAMARVTEIAREYAGCGVLLMDLIQEGGLALWQNIAREKEAREAAVRNAMARAVTLQARERGVGQKMRQALEDYRAVDERLLGELGRNPTLEEIAQELHMTPEDAETVRRCLEDARMLDRYVDTGAIYRTVAYFMDLWGVSPKDVDGVNRYIDELTIGIEYDDQGLQHMIMNGMDVTNDIRTQEISQKASLISAHAMVREVLLDMQRELAKNYNVVMDGRDIGSVVLPKATVKIFLTASPEVRAQRRYKELLEKGQKAKYEQVLKDVQQRDYQDTHREIAPLKMCRDSVKVDTSEMNLEESVAAIREIVEEKLSK